MTQRPLAQIIADLNAFKMKESISQQVLAKKAEVTQSNVSRVLKGKIKRVNRTVEKLCNYANIPITIASTKSKKLPPILVKAISNVWDGTETQAVDLARMLSSLSTLTGRSQR